MARCSMATTSGSTSSRSACPPSCGTAWPASSSDDAMTAVTGVFTGVGVALVTLFTDRGDLDAGATAALAAQLVDLGVQAVVVAGSTGEAASLDAGERAVLLAVVRSEIGGRVPLIAGTGAPSARQAAAFTAQAAGAGADAVLVLSPPG